jgi:hypothetical protein
VTPLGNAFDALNAEAGQVPLGPVIPMMIGQPAGGWGHAADTVGRTIGAVVVSVCDPVGPTTVTLIVSVPLVVLPLLKAKDAVSEQV